MAAFFFRAGSARARSPNPTSAAVALSEFTQAPGDGMAIQASDARQAGAAPATVRSGQVGHQQPPGAFVRPGHEAVEAAVLPGQPAVGMQSARGTSTGVVVTPAPLDYLGHGTLPLRRRCHQRDKVIVFGKWAKLFFNSCLPLALVEQVIAFYRKHQPEVDAYVTACRQEIAGQMAKLSGGPDRAELQRRWLAKGLGKMP